MEFELDVHRLEPWAPRTAADRAPTLAPGTATAPLPHSGLIRKPQQAILIPEEEEIPEQALG